ncbi:MAG TPA: hypothetical protein PK634_10990, partial [Kiritimatiellia bacterium]|nr:hypothetical protein [Kiritimatiellia bacterium]
MKIHTFLFLSFSALAWSPARAAMDLAVTKSGNPPVPAIGDTVTYTITATNVGDTAATSATVSDVLPSGVWYLNHSNGTYAVTNGAWSIGALDVGSSTSLLIQARVLMPPGEACVITNPTPEAGDYLGYSVAGLGSDKFIVGACIDNAGGTYAGSVYLYNTNGSVLVTITNPVPAPSNYFGCSVASLGSDKIIVGAMQDDTGADNAGSVYLYDMNGALLVTITNPAPDADDMFGNSVAGLGADKIIVGARYDDAGAYDDDAGGVYLYDTNGALL